MDDAKATQGIRLDVSGCLADRAGSGGLLAEELQRDLERWSGLPAEVLEERGAGRHAYLELERSRTDAEAAARFADEARPRFRRFVQCGIGGSAMGNRAAHTALPGDREVVVLDNVDPGRMRGLEGDALKDTIFHVVTKSGETAETSAQFAVVVDRLKRAIGETWREHLVVTTDPEKGTMRAICDELGLRTFAVPPGVGGRFSYLSPVGLLSLAFAGRDPVRVVDGAIAARERNLQPDSASLIYACLLKRFFDAERRQAVFWPYADGLAGLTGWWQQLLAESIGKRLGTGGDELETGPTPIAALGATDQHSVHQLFMEGPRDKWFTFVEVDDFGCEVTIPGGFEERSAFAYLAGKGMGQLLKAERKGTAHALIEAGRPVAVLHVPGITEHSLGALMATLMLSVTYAGALFGVDAYDQPGVEAGKQATFALLGREGYGGGAAIEQALAPDPAWVFGCC